MCLSVFVWPLLGALKGARGAWSRGPWCVVLMNICPLIVLTRVIMHYLKGQNVDFKRPFFAGVFTGLAFALYTISLIETSVV